MVGSAVARTSWVSRPGSWGRRCSDRSSTSTAAMVSTASEASKALTYDAPAPIPAGRPVADHVDRPTVVHVERPRRALDRGARLAALRTATAPATPARRGRARAARCGCGSYPAPPWSRVRRAMHVRRPRAARRLSHGGAYVPRGAMGGPARLTVHRTPGLGHASSGAPSSRGRRGRGPSPHGSPRVRGLRG